MTLNVPLQKVGSKVPLENIPVKVNNEQEMGNKQKLTIDLSILDEPIVKALTNLNTPKFEVTVNPNFISEVEKVIHGEFFEGRPTKTPLRYLKVRFHCFFYNNC